MTNDLLIITKSNFKLEDKLKVRWDECNGIDSKALNKPLNPLWRMNTNSTELPVIVLHLWDRGSRDVEETLFKASVYSYVEVCVWSEIVSCIQSYYTHIMDDGSERLVGFASRILSQAKKGYSQLDKEALCIACLGLPNFTFAFMVIHLSSISDHKSLMYLLGEHTNNGVGKSPSMGSYIKC